MAVLIAVADPTTVTVDPETGKLILASNLDPSACLQPGDGSPTTALDSQVCSARVTSVVMPSQELQLQVKVAAALDPNTPLPASALEVSGGEVVPSLEQVGPAQVGAFSVFTVNLTADAPDRAMTVRIPAGALNSLLPSNGTSAASNTIDAAYDTTGPQPVITAPGSEATDGVATGNPQPSLRIDFGERVLGGDPFALFNVTPPVPSPNGLSQLDAVYDVATGTVYLLGTVADPGAAASVTIQVPAGATTDVAGNPCAGTTFQLQYIPTGGGAAAGRAIKYSFAVGAPILAVGAALGFVPGLAVALMVTRVQTAYYVGSLPIGSMPPPLKAASDELAFITLPSA